MGYHAILVAAIEFNTDGMSTASNRALVDQFFGDVLNGRNPAAAATLLAPEFIAHHSALPGGQGGAAQMAELLATFRAGFPDLLYRVEEHTTEADRVVTRWTATGTHMGQFLNVPPTQRRVSVSGTDTFRVVSGKLREVWVCSDLLGLLQQIGAFPPPNVPRRAAE